MLYVTDGMFGDLSQHSTEIESRIKSIELGRADQTVHSSGALPAGSDPIERKFFLPRRQLGTPAPRRCCLSPAVHLRCNASRARQRERAYRMAAAVSLLLERSPAPFPSICEDCPVVAWLAPGEP